MLLSCHIVTKDEANPHREHFSPCATSYLVSEWYKPEIALLQYEF
jgi:hypothetical protein